LGVEEVDMAHHTKRAAKEERTSFARELIDARRETGLTLPPGVR
jgi:hypothetical protein